MSTWTYAPRSRAARRIGRSRPAACSMDASAWIGSKCAVRLESLSERLTRGIGPCWSRSMIGTSGAAASGPVSSLIIARQVCWYQSASASLMIASPSRSAVKASFRFRRPRTVRSASSGVAPAMNLRAITPAAVPRRRGEPFGPDGFLGRQSERHVQPPGDGIARLVEVLGQVPADRSGIFESGQGVDEPEELDADRRLIERHSHEPVVPPRSPPGPALAADPIEQLAADRGLAVPGHPSGPVGRGLLGPGRRSPRSGRRWMPGRSRSRKRSPSPFSLDMKKGPHGAASSHCIPETGEGSPAAIRVGRVPPLPRIDSPVQPSTWGGRSGRRDWAILTGQDLEFGIRRLPEDMVSSTLGNRRSG